VPHRRSGPVQLVGTGQGEPQTGGVQMNGVVVVTATKPSRSRIGQLGPPHDQRAVDALPAPGLDRRPAPEPRELAVRVEHHPGGGHHLAADFGDEHGQRVRVRAQPGAQVIGQPAPVLVEGFALGRCDSAQVATRYDRRQRDAGRKHGLSRDPSDLADDHGLGLLGNETQGPQPVAQISRLIVAVRLPLEFGPDLGVVATRAFDELVERGAGEAGQVAIGHEAAMPAALAKQRPVPVADLAILRPALAGGADLGVIDVA
jgi:hypothetical protein